MKALGVTTLLAVAAGALGGCPAQRQDPELCICESEACAAELAVEFGELDCGKQAFETGAPLFVLHRLPPDVDLDENVLVRLSTPCGARTFELAPDEGVSVLSTLAPPGSSCSLEIVASIANSGQRRQTHGTSDDRCEAARLSTECAKNQPVGGAGGAAGASGDD